MKSLLTFILLASTVAVFAQDKKITKSFSGIKSIEIETGGSDIVFKKSSNAETKVDLSYSYDDDEYKPVINQRGDALIIEEKFSRGSHSGSSRWVLEVPDNLDIDVNSGSADISLSDINSDLKVNVGSGDIEMTGMKGRANLNAGSGNIEASNVELELSFNTGSGDLRVSNSKGEFSLNAGSGAIRMENVNAKIHANSGSGSIRANGITLTGKSKFNTGSGNTTVTLAKALDHDISVNSGSGDATLNFNGNEISGEVTMTANKRGGDIRAPFKFDKEETIDDGNSSARIEKTARIGSKDVRIKVGTGSGTAEITK